MKKSFILILLVFILMGCSDTINSPNTSLVLSGIIFEKSLHLNSRNSIIDAENLIFAFEPEEKLFTSRFIDQDISYQFYCALPLDSLGDKDLTSFLKIGKYVFNKRDEQTGLQFSFKVTENGTIEGDQLNDFKFYTAETKSPSDSLEVVSIEPLNADELILELRFNADLYILGTSEKVGKAEDVFIRTKLMIN